ncbi:MAG: ATP-binding cassette domain-containing protein [Candidatus Cloacimonetes bacterium]|nr:ATP-binding cassette domain-containing protein [Candidatus Cloacimonadota bacterium]
MIKVKDLTKDYGNLRAVDNISFDIPDSGIIGILGPNGAGKTTTLQMITGFMPPTEGEVYVDNLNIAQNSLEIRKKIGYLPEGSPTYADMNVVDFLYFIAHLKNVHSDILDKRVKDMIRTYGLEQVVGKEINQLSKGFKQRVSLAGASIHNPEILILDEPTNGLDPNQIVEIRSLIKELGQEKTILVSTHILREVEAVCDHVIIIDKGKIVADNSLEEVQSSFHNLTQIYFEIQADTDRLMDEFETIPEVKNTQLYDKEANIYKLYVNYAKDKELRPTLYDFIKKKDWVILEMRRHQQTLEDVFRRLTEKDQEDTNE